MRYRLHQPVGFHKLIRDVLQKIFSIDFIGNASADEGEQTTPLALEDPRKTLVLLPTILNRRSARHFFLCVDEIADEIFFTAADNNGVADDLPA